MKEQGNILLISCYELGHPPFGLARLAALLQQKAFHVNVCDLAVEKLDRERVARAHFFGISVPMHTALRMGAQVAQRLRQWNPESPIAFFGLYASLNAKFLLEELGDFILGGEEEAPWVDLIQSVFQEANGKPRRPPAGKTLPPRLKPVTHTIPSRTVLLPLSHYAHLEKDGARFLAGYTETSRGCRHLCRHCPIPPVYQGRFALLSEESILQDIRAQALRGATHITFGDPDFFNGPRHSLKMVRKMRQEFPSLTFDFTAKIEHLLKYQDLLSELAASGCLFIISAVESLSDRVLTILHKGHTRADVMKVVTAVDQSGIALRPSLLPFTPWSTLEDYLDLFAFAENYNLLDSIDPVQYTLRLLVPPGSLLLSHPQMRPHLGPLVPEEFAYKWTHPDPRMDALQKEVSRWAEKGLEARTAFYQFKECAQAAHEGRPARLVPLPVCSDRKPPPRLTESWFCCAEPTARQLASLGGDIEC